MKLCSNERDVGANTRRRYRRFESTLGDAGLIPAVVVGAPASGTLGVVRSLSQANVPVILLDDDAFAPAMHTRNGEKITISRASGVLLVEELIGLATAIAGPAVLFLTSDDAVLIVSEFRAELQKFYRFQLPSHECLTSLMQKTTFQRLAEAYGFPVPRAVTLGHGADISRLAELRFPCIVKPTRATPKYVASRFAKAYKVTSFEQAESICQRILAVLPDVVVQEWVEGADSDLYFCLQYRAADGTTVCSFTGRKLSIWPPDIGGTASCTGAPEARSVLEALTQSFFQRVQFVGMGGLEFKKNASTGQFIMIEPTVGRIDAQEEVATMYGVNIPLAAYRHEIGLPVPRIEQNCVPIIWRDFWAHLRSARGSHSARAAKRMSRVYDAYWRRDDPIPALYRLLGGSTRYLHRNIRGWLNLVRPR